VKTAGNYRYGSRRLYLGHVSRTAAVFLDYNVHNKKSKASKIFIDSIAESNICNGWQCKSSFSENLDFAFLRTAVGAKKLRSWNLGL
jgi:hypothetical protein